MASSQELLHREYASNLEASISDFISVRQHNAPPLIVGTIRRGLFSPTSRTGCCVWLRRPCVSNPTSSSKEGASSFSLYPSVLEATGHPNRAIDIDRGRSYRRDQPPKLVQGKLCGGGATRPLVIPKLADALEGSLMASLTSIGGSGETCCRHYSHTKGKTLVETLLEGPGAQAEE